MAPPASALKWRGGRLLWGFYRTPSAPIFTAANRIDGPVRSLALVMSKFLAIGMSLPQVIDCVTAHAADGLRLSHKGRLEVGYDADLTLFTLKRRRRPCWWMRKKRAFRPNDSGAACRRSRGQGLYDRTRERGKCLRFLRNMI